MTRRSLALLLVALLPLSASAQTIYKCIDANGSTTYASSRLDKNCKVISSGPENTLPAPKAKPAGKELAEQEAAKGGPSDRTAPYRDRVGQHERNIQAIQKELGNLR